MDGITPKEHYRVISDVDRRCIHNLASQSGEVINMTSFGIQTYRIRFSEAYSIVESMQKESNNNIFILGKVLPQLATAADARKLVNKVLKHNKLEIARLKREQGALLRPILGNADGYYLLDLSVPNDRLCLTRLVEVSATRSYERGTESFLGYGALGDCSQKGNWSCFRNEWFNGKPVDITMEFISPMPKSGRLEFDFVSERRCGPHDFVLSDVRVVNMLIHLFLLRPDERDLALQRFAKCKAQTDRTLNGDGKTVYEVPTAIAKEVGLLMEDFYDKLHCRADQVEKCRQAESVKMVLQIDEKLAKIKAKIQKDIVMTRRNALKFLSLISLNEVVNLAEVHREKLQHMTRNVRNNLSPMEVLKQTVQKSEVTTTRTRRGRVTEVRSISAEAKDLQEFDASKIMKSDQGPNVPDSFEAENDDQEDVDDSMEDDDDDDDDSKGSKHDDGESKKDGEEESKERIAAKKEKHPLDEWLLRYVRLIASPNVSAHARASKLVEVVVEAFEHSYFMCRHLEMILDLFQVLGVTPTSEFFGTYRVELIVTLFGCLVDLHNFEIILRALTSFEMACVLCRIGWLHIFNPMKPQGAYELYLSRREERVVFKALAVLSTHEPGDSWSELSFRWERSMDNMPGFELTVPWMTEEGLPKNGLLNAYYYGGEGTEKKGCKPNIILRRAMTQLVFLGFCSSFYFSIFNFLLEGSSR